jgi:GT2 family glycosyltransferase
MKVSIVIPNYNGASFLEDCLLSLKKQTYTDFEIILVDNGSSDDSEQVAFSIYPDIRFISMGENKGFSKAVNAGIRGANGEYTVLLNNDTIATEQWLESLVTCIESDPAIFSCSSKMVKFKEPEQIDDAGDAYTIFGWAYQEGNSAPISQYTTNRQIFSSCAGAAIYRTRLFSEIGYFDEQFFAYLEDVDVGYRANIYGYKNIYCADAIIYHIGSATTGGGFSSIKVRLSIRNSILLIYKNQPILQMIINSPFIALGVILRYFFFKKLGLGKEYKDGLREAYVLFEKIEKTPFRLKFSSHYLKIQWTITSKGISYIGRKVVKTLRAKFPI